MNKLTKEQVEKDIAYIYKLINYGDIGSTIDADLRTARLKLLELSSTIRTALESVGEVEEFASEKAIKFNLLDGIYQDSKGNQITTKMLMEYEHQIFHDSGVLWIERPI